MNNIREVARENGISLAWLGEQIGQSRQNFNKKINADNFRTWERDTLAEKARVPFAKLFPSEVERVEI